MAKEVTPQAVQRCRIQSDTRYGAVHRLASCSNATVCGLPLASSGWWVLGPETVHTVTCRACLGRSNAGVACDMGEGPCACGAWH